MEEEAVLLGEDCGQAVAEVLPVALATCPSTLALITTEVPSTWLLCQQGPPFDYLGKEMLRTSGQGVCLLQNGISPQPV